MNQMPNIEEVEWSDEVRHAYDSIVFNHNPIEVDKAFAAMTERVLNKIVAAHHQQLQSLHTSLVAAVEGMRPPKRVPPEGESVPLSVLMRDSHINQALDDILTIINSIFKE